MNITSKTRNEKKGVAMADKCVICGEYVAEGDQVCWKCKARIDKCNDCKHSNSTRCLICINWKYSTYKSKLYKKLNKKVDLIKREEC